MHLQLEALTKRYPGAAAPALAGVSLAVVPGEILCLAGASGSGKTTLLRLVAGLETLTSGRLVLAGQTLADATTWVPPEERGIGLVPQDYALFPHLTVARNIAFGLHHSSRAERAERVAAMLALLRLEELAGRYPHELSGGQCQRVALARALAPQPRLLLLDEAFSSLDQRLRRGLVDELRGLLRRTGTTTLCITHDATDALALGDRLAILDHGRLCQVGTPPELYRHPAVVPVAAFFGDLNLLPATATPGLVESPFGPFARPAWLNGHRSLWLAVRPHQVQLADPGHGTAASIVDRRFLGPVQEVTVAVGAERCRLHLPTAHSARVGDTLYLAVHAEHAHLFPREP